MNVSATTKSEPASSLTLNDALGMLRRHWLTFTLIWMLVMLAAAGYLATSRPRFESTGVLYVQSPVAVGGASAAAGGLGALLGGGTENLESAKELLQSVELANRVISEMGLNASLEGNETYLKGQPRFMNWWPARDVSLYQNGLTVRNVVRHDALSSDRDYILSFKDATTFSVSRLDGTVVGEGSTGQPIRVGDDTFTLVNVGGVPVVTNEAIQLTIVSPQKLHKKFFSALSVDGGGRIPTMRNEMIQVTFASDSPFASQEVVQLLCDGFIEMKQKWDAASNRATLDFVKNQSRQLQQDLNNATEKLAEFQKQSGLVSLEAQVQVDMTRLAEAEAEQRMGELLLIRVKQMQAKLRETSSPDASVLAYADDPIITAMSEKLSELNFVISQLESRYQGNYPPLEEKRLVRADLLKQLHSTVEAYVKRVEEKQIEDTKAVTNYTDRLRSLPASARVLAEQLRSSRLYEQMYLFLLQEEQKLQMVLANTISSIRLVDPPFVPLREISPQPMLMIAGGAAAGLCLGFFGVLFQVARTTWFSTVEEVRGTFTQPVFAVLPVRRQRAKRGTPQMLELNLQSPFSEAVRQLRTNLLYSAADRPHQLVMLTSAQPGEGKSTIAANLAIALVRSEHVQRVLLIDVDMHKPTLHGALGLSASPGLSDYLNGRASLEQVTQTLVMENGQMIDVICAGPDTPSAVELLETNAMKQLIEHARNEYTVTILDAPPYPLTTSPLVLARMVDRVLSVCLLGNTNRRLYTQHVEDLFKINRHLGLLINFAGGAGDSYSYGSYGSANGRNGQATVAAPRRLETQRVPLDRM